MKIIFSKNIFKNQLFLFILIFPFYPINAINDTNFQNIFVVIEACCLLVVWIKIKKITPAFAWAILFFVFLTISTLMNNVLNIQYALFYSIRIVAFFMLIEICFFYNELNVLKVIDTYVFILFTINLFFQVFYQDYWGYTVSKNYVNFFVSDNELPFFVIPYICVCLFRMEIFSENKIFAILKIGVVYLNLLMAWCASGIISTSICLLLIAIVSKFKLKKIANFKNAIIGICGMYYFLVFANGIGVVDTLTIKLFGKSLGGARSNIWESAIENIKNKFWFGYGTAQSGRMSINYVNSYSKWYSHNFILEYLIQGGVVLFLLYLIGLAMIGKRSNELKRRDLEIVWVCVFFSMHIAYLTEGTIVEPTQYLLFLLGYHLKDLVNYKENSLWRRNDVSKTIRYC